MAVAARERAPPGRRQATGAVGADLPAGLVERPQLGQVVEGLLKVVAEDRLELEAATPLGVDLVGPAHEIDVQGGARALEKAAVDRVAHQVMVEAVQRIRVQRRDGVDESLARSVTVPSIAATQRSGASEATAGRGNCNPITDAGSIVARSSRPSRPRRPSISALIVGGIDDLAVALAHPALVLMPQAPLSTSIDSICSTYSGLPSAASTMRATTSAGSPVAPSRLTRPRGRFVGQRPQHQALAAGTLAPVGPVLQQLGRAVPSSRIGAPRTCRARHEQVEERRLGPVDVVEQRDQRAVGGRPSRNLRAAQ